MLTIAEAGFATQSDRFRPDNLAAATAILAVGPAASDEMLIQAIAQGNRHGMELLYARHSVRIYRFILRIADNATLAEDIVSDVFLDVWRFADGFKERSQVSTWLLAIARHKTLSALRRRSDEQLDDDSAAAIEDPTDDPEVSVDSKYQSAVVRK